MERSVDDLKAELEALRLKLAFKDAEDKIAKIPSMTNRELTENIYFELLCIAIKLRDL